jgi:hypothetical protein
MSEPAQKTQAFAVRQLAGHYGNSAGKTTEDKLRVFFLYGKNVKKRSRSTIALPSIKPFNGKTLKKDLAAPSFVRPKRESDPT